MGGNVGGKTGNVGGDGSEIQVSGYIAWSGTPVVTKGKNISSLTDRGTGIITVNTASDLPSINWVLSGSASASRYMQDDTGISRLVGAIPITTRRASDNALFDSTFSFQVTGA